MAKDQKNDRPNDIVSNALSKPFSRRNFLTGTSAAGLAAAAAPFAANRTAKAATPDGTPEQIHLTWGKDPARSVVVSWASAAQAVNPRVHLGHDAHFGRTIPAVQKTYTDGLNGQTVFTYHVHLEDLQCCRSS